MTKTLSYWVQVSLFWMRWGWQDGRRYPKAVPGKYKVRLTVGENSQTQEFEVLKDPRWDFISQADFEEQFELQVKIGKAFTQSHDLIKNVRSIRDQIKDISARADKAGYDESIKKAAEELAKKLTTIENDLIQSKNESRQDPINYQVKLDNQLAYVYSAAHSQDGKPAASILERYQELSGPLAKAAQDFEALVASDLKGFVDLLEQHNLPRIIWGKSKK